MSRSTVLTTGRLCLRTAPVAHGSTGAGVAPRVGRRQTLGPRASAGGPAVGARGGGAGGRTLGLGELHEVLLHAAAAQVQGGARSSTRRTLPDLADEVLVLRHELAGGETQPCGSPMTVMRIVCVSVDQGASNGQTITPSAELGGLRGCGVGVGGGEGHAPVWRRVGLVVRDRNDVPDNVLEPVGRSTCCPRRARVRLHRWWPR
jgi:hypothetical protein